MAVTRENPAPYAPASAILDLIDRYRNRGLARPFNAEVLGRAGVSDSLIARTLQALQVLELINEEGNPTNTLEGLRRAPEPELKAQLAAWITSVYADVLLFANANDDEATIRDAFRHYNPVGQQSRMVSLFTGLCRAAGMRADDHSTPKARPAARKAAPIAAVPKNGPTIQPGKGQQSTFGSTTPAPLAGLLAKLPPEDGSWTQAERDKFIATFTAVLDFCFAVAEKPTEDTNDS